MNALWQTELLRYAVSQHPAAQQWPKQHTELIEQAAGQSLGENARLQWLIEHLPAAAALRTSIDTYLHTVKTVRRLLYLVALLLGLASSFSLLSSTVSQVNLLHVTTVCALTPLFALVLWLIGWFLNSRRGTTGPAQSGFVGRLLAAVIHFCSRLLTAHQSDPTTHTAIVRGWQRLLADHKLRFWSLSLLTHTAWLTFSLGALLGAFIRLSLFEYDFYWGSTILPEAWLLAFLQWFFALPGFLSELVSGKVMMMHFQTTTAVSDERQLWGWLVLISIVFYGLLPRLILALFAIYQRHQALTCLPSVFSQPFYRQLTLQMHSLRPQIETPDTMRYPLPDSSTQNNDIRPASAQIAFELDGEPPLTQNLLDLGHIRGSRDYQQAINKLETHQQPVSIIAWCSLARSPDATTLNRLTMLQQLSQGSLHVQLTEADIARRNGIDLSHREADWRERLEKHGITQVSKA